MSGEKDHTLRKLEFEVVIGSRTKRMWRYCKGRHEEEKHQRKDCLWPQKIGRD